MPRRSSCVSGVLFSLVILSLAPGVEAQRRPRAAQPAPADAANSQSAAQPSTNTPIPPQTNGLPSSVNALDLRLGQRVRS